MFFCFLCFVSPRYPHLSLEVVNNGMTPLEALGATGHPCSVSQLYRRVRSMRQSMTESAKDETARFLLQDARAEIFATVSTSSNSSDLSTLTPSPRRQQSRKKRRKIGKAMTSR